MFSSEGFLSLIHYLEATYWPPFCAMLMFCIHYTIFSNYASGIVCPFRS